MLLYKTLLFFVGLLLIYKIKTEKKIMRNTISKVIGAGILCSLFVFTGCTKDALVGPPGGIGPIGPAGAPGNANVEEFDFITTAQDWVQSSTDSTWHAVYSSVSINKIDFVSASIVNLGQYTALPSYISGTNVFCNYSNTSTRVTMNIFTIPHSVIPNPGSQTFKIVVIPH